MDYGGQRHLRSRQRRRLLAVASTAQRNRMGQAMDALVAHRSKVGYIETRPMPTRNIATMPELLAALESEAGIEDDCSGTGKLIAHVAGLPPPDGLPYPEGAGNTETFYAKLPHYRNPLEAELGAYVFFGEIEFLSTQHLAVVRRPGADPVLFSHGGTGAYAAHFVPLSVEARLHVGQPMFLSIAHLS